MAMPQKSGASLAVSSEGSVGGSEVADMGSASARRPALASAASRRAGAGDYGRGAPRSPPAQAEAHEPAVAAREGVGVAAALGAPAGRAVTGAGRAARRDAGGPTDRHQPHEEV